MKKLKLSLSFAAILLGAGLAFMSASPASAQKSGFTTSWFTYNGSGDPTDPANYTKVTGEPACPEGSSVVCRIQATVGAGDKPVIGTDLNAEITFDVNHQTQSGSAVLMRD